MYCVRGAHDGPRTEENKPGALDWGKNDRKILLDLVHGKDKDDKPVVWETWKCEVCNKEWKMHLSYYMIIEHFEWCQKYYNDVIKEWNLKGIE